MIILAIDPGVSGAVAYISTSSGYAYAQDLPVVANDISAGELFKIIEKVGPDVAVVERVSAMPGNGAVSMFRFGRAYGAILACLACADVRVELVTPSTWKKAMSLPGKDKEKSRELALRLFPSCGSFLKFKKDHGKAEALLLAEYWRRKTAGAAP